MANSALKNKPEYYRTKLKKLPGTNYAEVYKIAYNLYLKIKRGTKRRPYVRSIYFNKNKIFLGIFWSHLHRKTNFRDKTRRAKYFPCAIELIKNSYFHPISKENPNVKAEILHRFFGITPDNDIFIVQIKENKKTGQKCLISVFPKSKIKKTLRQFVVYKPRPKVLFY